MYILHVLDHSIPLHSGYAFRTLAILREQRRLGWETGQLTGPKHYLDSPREEVVDGIRFHRAPSAGWFLDRLPVVNQYGVVRALEKRLDALCRARRPDILHAHSPSLNGLAALRIGARYGIPVVYEMRASWEDAAVDHGTTSEGSPRYRLSRALETRVLRKADAVVTISEGLKRDICARNIAPGRVTVVPNAVDLRAVTSGREGQSGLRERLRLEKSALVLGFVGSFYAYEGLDLMLEAMPALRARHPDVRLLLVGGGPEEARLRGMVAELGIGRQVVFAGRVPHAEVSGYYDLIDVCVFPRRSMRLTEIVTPLKPLEAMANRCAVVASNVGGHRELIRDRETGMLFSAGDSDALAAAIDSVVGDERVTRTLQDNGRAFVETRRNWAEVVRRYIPVYEGLTTPAA